MLPEPALAQQVVSASPDITIDLGAGVIANDEDVAVDNQLGIVVLENLGVLPGASEVIALGLDVNGDRLIAFDTTTALAGGVVARPGDLVRYDGATYSIEFDALAAGLGNGVATDAASLSAKGWMLSFDTTVDLGAGLVADDEDLVDWDGVGFSMALDGSAVGIDPALDIDGAQDIGGGSFLVSFDTTGSIAGVVFDDEDVLRFDGTNWSLEFDASAAHSAWAAADLDAVMVPEPGVPGLLLAGCALLFGPMLRRRIINRVSSSGRSRIRHRDNMSSPPLSSWITISILLLSFSASPVLASEGVLEINQACAVQTGCFPGDASGFPVTIAAPGSYRLTSNLVNTTVVSPHITLASSYVTLDLGGFEVSGPVTCIGTPPGCSGGAQGEGITRDVPSRQHQVVRNGTVRGTNLQGIRLGERATVEDVHVDDIEGTGISVLSFGTVRRSTVVSASIHGIQSASEVSQIIDNVVMSVGSSGIRCGEGCTISGNTTSGANDVGIQAGMGSNIQGNAVTNSVTGIRADPGSRIVGNTIRGNSGNALGCGTIASVQQVTGYRDNVISENNGTPPGGGDSDQGISGACLSLGTNLCGIDTNCP